MAEEPLVILCTAEELNHVLDKWIRDRIVRPFAVSKPPTEEERKKIIVLQNSQLCQAFYQGLLDSSKIFSQEA